MVIVTRSRAKRKSFIEQHKGKERSRSVSKSPIRGRNSALPKPKKTKTTAGKTKRTTVKRRSASRSPGDSSPRTSPSSRSSPLYGSSSSSPYRNSSSPFPSPLRPRPSPKAGVARNFAKKTARISAAYQRNAVREEFKEWLQKVGRAAKGKLSASPDHNRRLASDDDEEGEDTSEDASQDGGSSEATSDGSHSSHSDSDSEGEELLTDFSEEGNLETSSEGEDLQDILSMDPLAGSQRKRTKAGLLRKARGISDEDRRLIKRMIHENKDPAVIMNAAHFRPHKRRPRIVWTATEVMHLRLGVERFGLAWADILKCAEYKFHAHRTQVDLKDKWRNITNYRPYGSHGLREFIMVDENHQALLRPDTGKPYHFKNRWPRDAALKAASRDEFYREDSFITTLFVREVGSAIADAMTPPLVHVYEGTRVREAAPLHLSQLKIRSVWHSKVRKIREERYVSQEDLQRIEREARQRM